MHREDGTKIKDGMIYWIIEDDPLVDLYLWNITKSSLVKINIMTISY